MKAEVDKQLLATLGPKTEADLAKPAKKAAPAVKSKGKQGGAIATAAAAGRTRSVATEENADEYDFPPPSTNPANNKPHLLAKHLEETKGKVITRFPPEPNGYLHIGHAKALHIDFMTGMKLGEVRILFFIQFIQ